MTTTVHSQSCTGWSPWSAWSTCSRSCDGGASSQLRRCRSPAGCRGEAVRYKICNMQPCPEGAEFRAQQCSQFDAVPHEGGLLRWTPHYGDQEAPCALTCRGQAAAGDAVVARLADSVLDGTRCRPGSLDMCIRGECQVVGCDLEIGSLKKVDECGVCGGDGSSCARPLYHWEETASSLCSVTCGGGYKMSTPVCRNRVSGQAAQEELCDASLRPDPQVVQCNGHPCPAKWAIAEWGPCSASCGGGARLRQVHCAQEANGTKLKVPDHLCHGRKPRHQESCGQEDCPAWITDSWSGCSVSCGEGYQARGVHCKDAAGAASILCDLASKPVPAQPCRTGIPCPARRSSSPEVYLGRGHTQPLVHPYPPSPSRATAQRLVGQQVVPSESTHFEMLFACGWLYLSFIAEEWGPCSASCGEGVRRREVHCKIFLEFSKTIARLPDEKCQGPRPRDLEPCARPPCLANEIGVVVRDDPTRSAIKVAAGTSGLTYSWKDQGFTHCSASCLGGVQESLITCVQDHDQKPVSPYLCAQEARPEAIIRTCNDVPCPPRWNYSDFQPCTKPCGFGIQTREVNCIHEVTRGGANTVVVPSSMCPQPPPPDRQYCNVLDCPVRWHAAEWSKCSRSCGGGVKTRQVDCKQVMAQNHVVPRPPSKCPAAKPADRKPCNTKACAPETERPHIAASNTTYVQQKAAKKKVTLKVGGQATVFWGTQVKIKCPVKRFNRTKILWTKDRTTYLSNNKKYKISKKGALRIQDVTHRDSGVYTCVAGLSTADLALAVRSRPGEFLSSEEIEHQNRNGNRIPDRAGLDDPNIDIQAGPIHDARRPFPLGDDLSHEKPGEVLPPPPQKANRLWPPDTPPPPPPPPPARGPDEVTVSDPRRQQVPAAAPSRGPVAATEPPASPPRMSDSVGDPPPVSSGGARPLPHIQQLLANLQDVWPFQTFSNSRGHRTVTDAFEPEQNHTEESDEMDGMDALGSFVILGKGKPENLKFDWVISEWSKCSESCGGSGFQMRAAHCTVQLHNNTQSVDRALCEDAGLEQPSTLQKCGNDNCPRWTPGAWSPCEVSRCFTWNTAMQRRDTKCQLSNGTEADARLCGEERPPQRQECYNDKCKGTWKVGEWSECAAPCETQGIKYRILQCVWFGTKKPAGNACRDQPRPSVMKVCKGLPCSHVSECKDRSKYCQNVKAMNLCRITRYHYQCCQACRNRG
ncbi:protein madd-4 [Bacillus rossius redtenbacheri]|uniref:protein madd-4 n=1 Tax=Bacillus rossius redtenbacheri TaxID=93214 RepID=UPI002FDDD4BA